MEFLWEKVGSYATKEGVTLKMDVTSTGLNNKYTLNFTTSGSYVGVISYIYSLENDSELAFRIENFKMVSGGSSTQASSSGTVTGTFSVNNVSIETETISSSDNGSSSSSTQRANNSESDSNINTEGQ